MPASPSDTGYPGACNGSARRSRTIVVAAQPRARGTLPARKTKSCDSECAKAQPALATITSAARKRHNGFPVEAIRNGPHEGSIQNRGV
jgi:hypothetical protein